MTLAIFGGKPARRDAFPAWPQFSSEEETALSNVLHSGRWGGYGNEIRRFEEILQRMQEVSRAVSCANGTVALEVALRSLGVQCGDEVIVTPFSFIASASAILLCHAVPVFADIDPKTLNISPSSIEAVISSKTKAIIVVHFGGHPADMDAIQKIAEKNGLFIVEDCAHAHGARWKGAAVGNFGAVGTFSFQSYKLATSGEGGVIVTNDDAIADRAWAYCNQGRRPGGAWYEHHTLGTNYRLTAFQAAVLCAQMQRLPEQTAIRARNADYLRSRLQEFEGIETASPSEHVENHPNYLTTLRFKPDAFAGISRDVFLAAVNAEGIPLSAVYPHPLYANPLFQRSNLEKFACRGWESIPDYSALHLEECERVCLDGLWLDHHLLLGNTNDMDDIVATFHKVRENSGILAKHQEEATATFSRS
jgi:dTDP-4-amino-4,6-dideoxygalactose transaminase